MPARNASRNAAHIPTFICVGVSSPVCVARGGPSRSPASAPRSKSNTSFAKFAPICRQIAPNSAATNGPAENTSSPIAAPVPTSTGATAAVSVGGRAAATHAPRLPGAGSARSALTPAPP